MRKKLILNTVSSILLQIISISCSFIIPRLILGEYGSSINGLIQSITQFLMVLSFLELGIGAVMRTALYKPLFEKDNESISKIVKSGHRFYNKIAFVLTIYVCLLIFFYPCVTHNDYDWLFTATLILSISLGSFAQYFFGAVDGILLSADQRNYITYFSQCITFIINAIISVLLIKYSVPIQIVKLSTSLCFLIRPIIVKLYIKSRYAIDKKITYTREPIPQKKDGIAQHISYTVVENTDTIVLTLFSTLSNVSVYSVYHMVIYGVKQLFQSLTAGLQSIVGELWARDDKNKLVEAFICINTAISICVSIIYTCTGILAVPFVRVYTMGVFDANYTQPAFAVILVLAHAVHSLKEPFNMVILASGHYKETKWSYILSAIINLVVSIVGVFFWGLVGVAIGTLVSMVFQTVWMVCYFVRNLVRISFLSIVKPIVIDVCSALLICIISSFLTLTCCSFLEWILLAIKVGIIALITCVLMWGVFCRKEVKTVWLVLRKRKN